MTININFEGLNKILCKFGIHRFTNWETDTNDRSEYGLGRYCNDCPRYEFKHVTTKVT